jgi:CyaY protein
MSDENDFRKHAEEALNRLYRALSDASDDYEFEPEMEAGALTVEFERPKGKFVISPNAPVRQIWVSALSRSFKLDWDPVAGTFVKADTGQNLEELVAEQIGKQIGKDISL